MLIYIIETPKDSLRLSLGLAVSCALSRLWYYCGRFCGRYEWKVFLGAEKTDSPILAITYCKNPFFVL